MSLHRTAARRDANEPAIVKALEAVGATVRPVSSNTLPDLVVGFRGVTYLLGVKIPDGPRGGDRARRKDRPSGDERPANWNGGPWAIVTSPAEALAVIGARRPCLEDVAGLSDVMRGTVQPAQRAVLNGSVRSEALAKSKAPDWLVPTAHAPVAEVVHPDDKEPA